MITQGALLGMYKSRGWESPNLQDINDGPPSKSNRLAAFNLLTIRFD